MPHLEVATHDPFFVQRQARYSLMPAIKLSYLYDASFEKNLSAVHNERRDSGT